MLSIALSTRDNHVVRSPPRSTLSRTSLRRMQEFPAELRCLLDESTPAGRDDAWARFLDAYSRLVLHVARTTSSEHDDAMDAYTHVLQELRANDFARLRTFSGDGRCKFSTWLVVVIRRLCYDHRRQRYGRSRETRSSTTKVEQNFRRRLRDLSGEDIELTRIPDSAENLDEHLSARELRGRLAAVVDSLPPNDRLLLALRFEDSLSAQTIARILHLRSPFHVYRRLGAIMRALRSSLAACGFEDAVP